MKELKLPELGENIETADVSSVLVSAGDSVQADQPVIEVETEKASLEVPATSGGTISEVRVKQGDKISVGDVILVIDSSAGEDQAGSRRKAEAGDEETEGADRGEAAAGAEPDRAAGESREEREEREEKQPAGKAKAKAKTKAKTREHTEAGPEEPDAPEEPEDRESEEPEEPKEPEESEDGEDREAEAETRPDRRERAEPGVVAFPVPARRAEADLGDPVPAAPSVRALARELGVDLGQVQGSGPGGRISRPDVKAHAKRLVRGGAGRAPGGGAPAPELPDFSQWGEIERRPLSAVRRATARGMATAWATVPHVTQFDHADITQVESMRRKFNTRAEARGHKLTLTAIVIKVAAAALKQFPEFNAALDLADETVIYRKSVHIGVAVDTERGLLVPVIRDADRAGLLQVAASLDELAGRARDKKLKPDEMRGASFTVSNLGGLGTTYFSPIVNWPQVAILGVGRAATRAVWDEGQFKPALIMPLSLSYDHRLIDGAGAARFLRWIAEALEQPLLLLLDDSGN